MTTPTSLATAPRSAARTPQVLRCSGTADFLAALPFITGFTADDSLILVLFSGRRASNAVRFNLPEKSDPRGVIPLIDAICTMLVETGAGAERPAVVLTCTETFAAAGGVPWRRFARILQRRIRHEGWELREFAVVAPDGWAGLLDSEERGLRRPLDEIRQSPVAAQARETEGDPRRLDELGLLPEADPIRSSAVLAQLAELDRCASGPTSYEPSAPWRHGVARLAESCFGSEDLADPRELEARLCARLIRASESSETWLVVALTAVEPWEAVVGLLESVAAAYPGPLPTELPTPESNTNGDGEFPAPSIRLILSVTSEVLPDPVRLDRVISVLGEVAAHAPQTRRSGLLALLAWCWWIRGLQTVAVRLAEESLEIDAQNPVGQMVDRLVATPPRWLIGRFPFAPAEDQP